jgi:L-rhamnose isomerase
MLPEVGDYEYKAQPVDDREDMTRMLAAAKYGRRAVQRIATSLATAMTPRGLTAVTQSAEKAWAQARLADNVTDADWLAHLDEVNAVQQLTRALRTSVVPVAKRPQAAGTRLITLHEDN